MPIVCRWLWLPAWQGRLVLRVRKPHCARLLAWLLHRWVAKMKAKLRVEWLEWLEWLEWVLLVREEECASYAAPLPNG